MVNPLGSNCNVSILFKSIKIGLWKIMFNTINNIDFCRDDDAGRGLLIRHCDCIITSNISNYNLSEPTIVLKILYHFIMIINIKYKYCSE